MMFDVAAREFEGPSFQALGHRRPGPRHWLSYGMHEARHDANASQATHCGFWGSMEAGCHVVTAKEPQLEEQELGFLPSRADWEEGPEVAILSQLRISRNLRFRDFGR
jgi:hypothetical protein